MPSGVIGRPALRRFHQVGEDGKKRLKQLRVERLTSFPTEHVNRILGADRFAVVPLQFLFLMHVIVIHQGCQL